MIIRKSYFLIISLFLFVFSAPKIAEAKVVINEIAWMGNNASANDEWIELYNPSSENIKIDGWILKTEDNGIKINLKGEIPTMGFFLLERTDDNSVVGIKADLIYQGALSNNGEILKLIDSNGNIVDEVNCSTKWLAGDNKTKQTMERAGLEWQTSQNPNGTPRAINSIKSITSPSTENAVNLADRQTSSQINDNQKDSSTTQTVKPSPLPILETPKNYPSNIFLSEILPSPEGSDTENEFIEIFNANNFEVDASGFKIKDKIGAIKTYILPENTKIVANGFLAFKSSQTKISLNNTGDGVELLNPSDQIIDSIDYAKAKQGQSWSKAENTWQWTAKPTPGQANIFVAIPANATSSAYTTTSQKTNNLTANITSYPPQRKNFLAVGIATAIALSSALIAWRIKKNSTEI